MIESRYIVATGRALAGEPYEPPKGGARFSFSLPGAVQGLAANGAVVANRGGALAIRFSKAARAVTPTFTPPDAIELTEEGAVPTQWLHPGKYALLASPTLYPGQTVCGRVDADRANEAAVFCRLTIATYDELDGLSPASGRT